MKKSTLEKVFIAVPIAIAFVVVGLIVLAITGTLSFSRPVIDLLIILGIIAFGMLSCMLPVKMLAKDKKNIPAWVIIGLTGLVCLLWIIFVFIGQGVIDAITGETFEAVALKGIWVYTQITIFLTIQTGMVSLVVSNIYVFKKTMIPFQVVMYLSNLIVDVWFTILVFGISINDSGFNFGANFLWDSKFILTLFILALAFTILSSAILKGIQKRRQRLMTMEDHSMYEKNAMKEPKQTDSIEDRIKKLDDLKAKGVITQEEYDAKRSKLIEDL